MRPCIRIYYSNIPLSAAGNHRRM